jgi:5-methylcytosine-specific restriction endonuclease McrA
MSYKVKFCSLLCDTENRETIEARKSEIKRAKEEEARRFYSSPEWGALRIRVLAKYGRVCAACGRTDGRMHIDHIYPRSKYPHLALDFNNLQVLCEECNIGKSNTLIHDFRDEIAV